MAVTAGRTAGEVGEGWSDDMAVGGKVCPAMVMLGGCPSPGGPYAIDAQKTRKHVVFCHCALLYSSLISGL